MMAVRAFLLRLRADTGGSVAVEFALAGPLFIAMLIGVLQVGIALQSYNAMRNVSADIARDVTVQYQTGNVLTNTQIRGETRSRAIGAPYLLNEDNLYVSVVTASDQRITGAREITLYIQYQIPSIMPFFDFSGLNLNYQRPIFVLV